MFVKINIMKVLTVIFRLVFVGVLIGSLYLLTFEPALDLVEKLQFIYLIFISVFVLYLDYRQRNNIF